MSLVMAGAGSTGSAFSAPHRGDHLLVSGRALSQAIRGGNWLDGGLAFLDTLGNASAALTDPIGTIASCGLGWVMEHLKPLTTWLDQLAGSAANVAGVARQWVAAGSSLRLAGGTLAARLRDLDGLSGETVSSYIRFAQDTSRHLVASGEWAESAASGLTSASSLVAKMQGVVKTAISQVIATAIEAMAVVAASFGLGMGYAIARVITKVNQMVTKVVRPLTQVVRSVTSLTSLVQQLRSLFEGTSARMSTLLGGTPQTVAVGAGSVIDASSATRLGSTRRAELIRAGRVADAATHHLSAVTALPGSAGLVPLSDTAPTPDGPMTGSTDLSAAAPAPRGSVTTLGLSGAAVTAGAAGTAGVAAIVGGTAVAGSSGAGRSGGLSPASARPGSTGPLGSASAASGANSANPRSGMGVRRRRLTVVIEPLEDD